MALPRPSSYTACRRKLSSNTPCIPSSAALMPMLSPQPQAPRLYLMGSSDSGQCRAAHQAPYSHWSPCSPTELPHTAGCFQPARRGKLQRVADGRSFVAGRGFVWRPGKAISMSLRRLPALQQQAQSLIRPTFRNRMLPRWQRWGEIVLLLALHP